MGVESRRVVVRRYEEGRGVGLTRLEARLFAESTIDVGKLRSLVKAGCKPQLIAKILL